MNAPLADRLNKLFEVMHRVAEPMISDAAAAAEITRRCGVAITHEEIRQLRLGTKRDATVQQLSGIAEFFGVPAGYLLHGDPMLDAQLDLLQAMRDSGVRCLRSCRAGSAAPEQPTPQTIYSLAETIRRLRPG